MKKEKKKILLVGGGGHARVLIDLLRTDDTFEAAGILDTHIEGGTVVNGVTVLGNDGLLPSLFANGITNVCIAVGSIRDNSRRRLVFELVRKHGFRVPCLVHRTAVVSKADMDISEGVQVMAGAVIQTGCVIGENTLVNTGAIVEHDCRIGRNVHICPGAVVCGGSVIGDNSFIGAGTTVIQGIEIGRDTVIGAGSVIRQNTGDGVLVRGT